jgi:hypothetical protein
MEKKCPLTVSDLEVLHRLLEESYRADQPGAICEMNGKKYQVKYCIIETGSHEERPH